MAAWPRSGQRPAGPRPRLASHRDREPRGSDKRRRRGRRAWAPAGLATLKLI